MINLDGRRLLLAALAASVAFLVAAGGGPRGVLPAAAQDGAPPLRLSSIVPFDAVLPAMPDPQKDQEAFDAYSWNAFIALNWPAAPDKRGVPDADKKIGEKDLPTVWETYKSPKEVFRGDATAAKDPGDWDDPPQVVPCEPLDGAPAPAPKELVLVTKSLEDLKQAESDAPLIDQNGHFVHYEIRLNRDEFEDIKKNRWWDSTTFTPGAKITFSSGSVAGSRVGAMEIKAAWKILGTSDDPHRFHTARALIAWPKPGDQGHYLCRTYTVGLVGFHVAHKTENAPQWIWSTFEHVDNYSGDVPSFFDPRCRACPLNKKPRKPGGGWNQDPQFIQSPPTQVQPVAASLVRPEPPDLNAKAQELLRRVNPKSVWQYYQLVSTQWPFPPARPGKIRPPNGGTGVVQAVPAVLANTTMETYLRPKSSCMHCHEKAKPGTDTSPYGKRTTPFTDFSYVLVEAYPAIARRPTAKPNFSGH